MKLIHILLITIFFNLNSSSKIGKFFKKIGREIKKPFENIAHNKELKKDVQQLASFISKLKDEDLVNLENRILDLIGRAFSKDALNNLKQGMDYLRQQIQDIQKLLVPLKDYQKELEKVKEKNENFSQQLKNVKEQIQNDTLNQKKIDKEVHDFHENLSDIQQRETVKQNVMEQVQTKVDDIVQNQKQIETIAKDQKQEIDQIQSNYEIQVKKLEDIQKQVQDLDQNQDTNYVKFKKEQLKQEVDVINSTNDDLQQKLVKKIKNHQDFLEEKSKQQQQKVKDVLVLQDGMREMEQKKKQDLQSLLYQYHDYTPKSNRSLQYMNQMQNMTQMYLYESDN